MREPNLSFPSQNKAAVCITSALYDRRALDCTATLPLLNSLTQLVYLTSTTPRIREIVCVDGGLDRLVRILYQKSNKVDRLTIWKWTLAFEIIVNIGVRGTEEIRTKVVNSGVIPFVLNVLDNFSKSYIGKKQLKNETKDTVSFVANVNDASVNNNSSKSVLQRSTFPYVKIDSAQRRFRRAHRESKDLISSYIDHVFRREEDVVLCLQLLGYVSKYPHIRDLFHTIHEKNVFSVVEKFCDHAYPSIIRHWANITMRNACRKDETRGGIRRCAYMFCGKWESQPREFAKCRRCRKAKYCSKQCQSKAWAAGHRWWCVERPPASTTSMPNVTASFTNTNNTTMPRTTTHYEQSSPNNDARMDITDNGESSESIFNVNVNF